MRSKSQPTWTDVKGKLAGLDHKELLSLVQDLYTVNKDNQTFLHARFALIDDVLKSYKETIARWIWPDVLRKQDTSVAKAKQAITDYKKAVGDPAGIAELMVFFCEQATRFCNDIFNDDENYVAAAVRMFEQAFIIATTLPPDIRSSLIDRLDRVRTNGRNLAYGGGEDLDSIFTEFTKRKP